MRRLQLAALALTLSLAGGGQFAYAQTDDTSPSTQAPVQVETTQSDDPCQGDNADDGCCGYEDGSVQDQYLTPIEEAAGLDQCDRRSLACVAVQIVELGACVYYPTDDFYGRTATQLGWD